MENVLAMCGADMGLDEEEINLLQQNIGEIPMEEGLFILTNNKRLYASGLVLYPELLEGVADILKDDLILLPSSVHEWILKKASGSDLTLLKEMVMEVNQTQLKASEYLSDEVYYYDRRAKKVLQATQTGLEVAHKVEG